MCSYSLTLTDGIQSSTILPENNIIVSINGVLQEPGVGFEIVGSRIIFSEVPRFGSTFVAFSYVGSEADVDADTVVPPVEAGDFIDIEGEISDREVAVIESSNSLITFDYLGSVFGQNANASANLTTGFIERVSITSGGSGYTSPPTVTIAGTLQQGGVEARAETTIANGEVVTISLVVYNGFKGGKGYSSSDPISVNIAAPQGSGTQAQANALLESRLYGNIVNQISMTDTDTFESSDIPAVTIDITRVVNTSSFDANNWVSLSSNQIAASDITSGTIETDRLATGGTANSFTFLRGDQSYSLAVQSIKGAEVRYFDKLYSTASSGSNQLIFQN